MCDANRASSKSCNIVQAAVKLGSLASLSGAGLVQCSNGQEEAAAHQAGRLEGLAPPEQILHQRPHILQLHYCCQALAVHVAVQQWLSTVLNTGHRDCDELPGTAGAAQSA